MVDTGTVVCGICGKPARDDQYTVPYRARRTGTFDEPPPQERIAHTECFRREILRLDW